MARIAGIDLPREKKIAYALPYIFGIGASNARVILAAAAIDPEKRTKDLTDDEVVRLSNIIAQKYKVEGDLRREVGINIKRLMDIGSYRGQRHRKSLPVRGQRTRTNARTRKGKKKTVGAKKKATK